MSLDLDMVLLTNQPDAADACRRALQGYAIPETLHGGLVRYLVDGIRPGSFLSAVLENDLLEAVLRAEPVVNLVALPALMRFLVNEAPSASWGNPDRVTLWTAERQRVRSATP